MCCGKLPFCCPSTEYTCCPCAVHTSFSVRQCNTDAPLPKPRKYTHLAKTDCRPGPPTVMYSALGVASSTTRRPPGSSSCSTLQMALQGQAHAAVGTHIHTQSTFNRCGSGVHTSAHASQPPAQSQTSAHYRPQEGSSTVLLLVMLLCFSLIEANRPKLSPPPQTKPQPGPRLRLSRSS